MNKESSIGIFDSGIGGVTVLKEIIKILPNENYIYYSDSKNNPYGDKQNSEIISICDNKKIVFQKPMWYNLQHKQSDKLEVDER